MRIIDLAVYSVKQASDPSEVVRWYDNWNKATNTYKAEQTAAQALAPQHHSVASRLNVVPFHPATFPPAKMQRLDERNRALAGKGDPYLTQPFSLPRMAVNMADRQRMTAGTQLTPYRAGIRPSS